MSENETLVLREDRDSIATLTLNRPAARNALSTAMMTALEDAFAAVEHDRRSACSSSPAPAPASAPGTTCARSARPTARRAPACSPNAAG